MGEGRGKKARRAADWKVHLGIKELIFAGLGVAGMVMMSFALGTLAGRGDIYRLLNNWGLLGPDGNKVGQIWYQAPPPPSTPVAALSNPPSQEPETPAAGKPGPTSANYAEKAPSIPPVKASLTATPAPPAQAKKKSAKPEVKGKEDKLEKIRQEVASKLKFQNSLDLSATRTAQPGDKTKKGPDKEPPVASKAQAAPMIVAKYRDAAQAKARLAQMQKQGDKVILKEGKDNEGQYFAICRQVPPSPTESPQVAQNHVKKTKPDNNKATKGTGDKEGASR